MHISLASLVPLASLDSFTGFYLVIFKSTDSSPVFKRPPSPILSISPLVHPQQTQQIIPSRPTRNPEHNLLSHSYSLWSYILWLMSVVFGRSVGPLPSPPSQNRVCRRALQESIVFLFSICSTPSATSRHHPCPYSLPYSRETRKSTTWLCQPKPRVYYSVLLFRNSIHLKSTVLMFTSLPPQPRQIARAQSFVLCVFSFAKCVYILFDIAPSPRQRANLFFLIGTPLTTLGFFTTLLFPLCMP